VDIAGGSVFVGGLVVPFAVSVGIGMVVSGVVGSTVAVVITVVAVLVGMPFGWHAVHARPPVVGWLGGNVPTGGSVVETAGGVVADDVVVAGMLVVVVVGCTVGVVGAGIVGVGCVVGVVVGIPAGWQVIQASPPVAGWLGGRVSVAVVVVGVTEVAVVSGGGVSIGVVVPGREAVGVGVVVGIPFGWQLIHGKPPVAG
jgi:hypothetical protein